LRMIKKKEKKTSKPAINLVHFKNYNFIMRLVLHRHNHKLSYLGTHNKKRN